LGIDRRKAVLVDIVLVAEAAAEGGGDLGHGELFEIGGGFWGRRRVELETEGGRDGAELAMEIGESAPWAVDESPFSGRIEEVLIDEESGGVDLVLEEMAEVGFRAWRAWEAMSGGWGENGLGERVHDGWRGKDQSF